MGDYDFILDNFTWSFSRLESFENCPMSFYLNYILKKEKSGGSFGEYGSHCHNILERYFRGELMVFELTDEFTENFTKNVITEFPPNAYVDLGQKYYQEGIEYFSNFTGLDESYEVLGVEAEHSFKVGDYNFTGIVDLELKKGNEFIILDHKSKSKNDKKRLSAKDNPKEYIKLTDGRYIPFHMAQQLYLYSLPFKEKYGEYPKYLEWNMFRIGDWYKLEFNIDDYNRTLDWIENTIEKIYKQTKWTKGNNTTQFFCDHICSVNRSCSYSSKYMRELA